MIRRIVLAVGCAGCMYHHGSPGPDPTVGQNDPGGAAILAASAVGFTGVNRALTGACYSSCPYGRVCNHDTGFCETSECNCPEGQTCERAGGRVSCVTPVPRSSPRFSPSAAAWGSPSTTAAGDAGVDGGL